MVQAFSWNSLRSVLGFEATTVYFRDNLCWMEDHSLEQGMGSHMSYSLAGRSKSLRTSVGHDPYYGPI